MSAPIPLTVIGGFLGSGKTTLVNHLLAGQHGVRFAVLVNDFGDLVIDDALIKEHGGDTISFANGCVCCTLGDNFMLTLDRLLSASQPPQHILVEASGVADPQSIADIATLHPALRRDLTIVLADTSTLRERANDEYLRDTVQRQLNAADLIVLNKCDLLADDELACLKLWLTKRTQVAAIESQYAEIPLALLTATTPQLRELNQHSHNHRQQFSTTTLSFSNPVDLTGLMDKLRVLPSSVLRAKGFVKTESNYYLLQLSGRTLESKEWADDSQDPQSALVFIGTPDMPNAEELHSMLAARSNRSS